MHINSIRECVQRRRLQWFGHVERMEPTAWPSLCRNLVVNGKKSKGRPRLTWNEVIKKDLKEKNLSKELAQDRNAWKSCITQSPTHASMEIDYKRE